MVVPERPVLVAPDSFKGMFNAARVAGAIGRGLERAGLMPPDLCPVADGGEGTLDALLPQLGGELIAHEVKGPLGDPVRTGFGLIEDGGTAIVELAMASGLGLVPEAERDAWNASTYGTGQLIAAAAHAGAAVILVAVGGSATTDGGAGALQAIEDAGGIGRAKIVVLCDVRTGGLWAKYGAALEAGAPFVLDALDFDQRMRAARAVVTGEGKLDEQTLQGKLVGEIGTRTRQAGVPLHAIVGSDALDGFGKRMIDLQMVQEATNIEELEAAGERLGRALATGEA